jgi:hypothetical protein
MLRNCGSGGEGARTNNASNITICMDVTDMLYDMDDKYQGCVRQVMNKYLRLADLVWK